MYLGIDIGGTKTLLMSFTNSGKPLDSVKFKTPKDYSDFKEALAENLKTITTNRGWDIAAIGTTGRIDHEKGMIIASGRLPWRNVPIQKDVKTITHCDVLLENDAKLAGLSEARLLKPVRHKALYVTVSTGIGGALIVDGNIDKDLADAEIGHMLMHERNGKLVTWESIVSGKAIVKRFGKRASDIADKQVWKIICEDLALGLIDAAAAYQPDIIIIGGGVGSHFKKFAKPLREALEKYESPLVEAPRVVGAKNAEEAVIYGCYELIKDHARTT